MQHGLINRDQNIKIEATFQASAVHGDTTAAIRQLTFRKNWGEAARRISLHFPLFYWVERFLCLWIPIIVQLFLLGKPESRTESQ